MNKVVHGSGGMLGGGKAVTNAPDTLRSEDTIEFTLGICEGPIAGLADGAKTFFLGDTPLVSQNEENNFDSFELHIYHGDDDASKIKNALGGISSNTGVGVQLAEATPVTRSTPPELADTIDILELRLNFAQLFYVNEDGTQVEATAKFKIEYKKSSDPTWTSFFEANRPFSVELTHEFWTENSRGTYLNTSTSEVNWRGNLVDTYGGNADDYAFAEMVANTSESGYTHRVVRPYGTLWFNNNTSAYKFVADTAAAAGLDDPVFETLTFTKAGETDQFSMKVEVRNSEIIYLTGKTTSTYVKEFRKRVPRTTDNWDIRITKLNSDTDDKLYCTMSWESFQCITKENKSYDNLVVARGLGVGSNQFSSIPQFGGVYHGKLIKIPSNYNPVTREYIGNWDGTFKLGYTDNPVWCLYDLLDNAKYGVRAHYPQLMIDRFSFYDAAQWCDELVPRPSGGYQPRYTYNDIIQESRQGLEQIHYIAALFGGLLTEDWNGSVVLKVDKPSPIVQVFGLESVSEEGFSYGKTDITTRANDIEVTFTNPNLDWSTDVRRVYKQSWIDKNGRIPLKLVTVGCLDVYEAQRRGQLRLISANTEIISVSFQTARQGMLLEPLDIIGIADPDMRWGASGRIKGVSGTSIQLRDPIYLNMDVDLEMTVQGADGPETLTVQNNTGGVYAVELTVTSGSLPNRLPPQAQFTLASTEDLGLVKPFRILNIVEVEGQPDLFSISAMEVNFNKWGDADNMTSSGMQKYAFTKTQRPTPPFNLTAVSGTEHLLISTDGHINSRIYISWEQNSHSFAEEFHVFYRRQGHDRFKLLSCNGNDTYIDNVQDGKTYEIYIKAKNAIGKLSRPSQHLFHTVVGKTERPSDVVEATATQIGTDVQIDITPVSDLDVSHYVVRVDEEKIGTTVDGRFIHKNVSGTTLNYSIKAVDTTNHRSENWFEIVHNIPSPSVPGVSHRFVGDQIEFSITPPTGQNVPIKEYQIERDGEEIYRGTSLKYQLAAEWSGIRNFTLRSVNMAGKVSSAVNIVATVNPPAAPNLVGYVTETGVFRLTWNEPTSTLPITHYVLKVAGGAIEDGELKANTYTGNIDWLGDRTYEVWAVDTAGNIGSAGSFLIDIVEPSVSTISAYMSKSELRLTWTGVKGSMPIKEYHLYEGATPIGTMNSQTYTMAVNWNGSKTFNVYAEDILGNLSSVSSHTETVDAPQAPNTSISIKDQNVQLVWDEPVSELTISKYQIYKDGNPLQTLSGTSVLLPVDWLGVMDFGVAAIDSAGNLGVSSSVSIEINTPSAFSLDHMIEADLVRLKWTTPSASLPIREYIVKRAGLEVTRLSGNTYTFAPDWSGTVTYSVEAVDTSNNHSPVASTSIDIYTPSAPTIRAEVLDNNVLLRWTNGSGTLPVVATEIRKGATFATAEVLHKSDSTFAAFFEFEAGKYDYWAVNLDSAGNYGTEFKLTTTVSEPPDFILQANMTSLLDGAKTNVIFEDDVLYFGVDGADTWAEHFTDNSFTSPQDQIDAGFPFYMQPVDPGTASYYDEDIDYGTVISSSIITATPTVLAMDGDGAIQVDIWYRKQATDAWTQVTNENRVYALNFRYVKVRLNLVADTADDLVRVSGLNVRLDTKIRNDAGNGTAAAGDTNGTTVNFNVNFIDVQSISVTPLSTTPVIAIYDFEDTPNPTTFSVYLFDKDGVRVSGDFSWNARGF